MTIKSQNSAGAQEPIDPYGQPVQFNGRHVSSTDYEGKRVSEVPKDSDAELAVRLRNRAIEEAGTRYGLPALIVSWIAMEFIHRLT